MSSGAPRPDPRYSLLVPGLLLVAWAAVALVTPGAIAAFIHPVAAVPFITEGPADWIEEALLITAVGYWTVITARARRLDTARFAVAAVMWVQLAVLLGEEFDWGQNIGLRPIGGKNLRELLRAHGIKDLYPMVGTAMVYFLVPLVPVPRVRAFLARLGPIVATPWDAVAVLALIVDKAVLRLVTGVEAPSQFVHLGIYTILLLLAIRIAGQLPPVTGSDPPPP
jgi:hypothetical protein